MKVFDRLPYLNVACLESLMLEPASQKDLSLKIIT